jgi:hypothetical protein
VADAVASDETLLLSFSNNENSVRLYEDGLITAEAGPWMESTPRNPEFIGRYTIETPTGNG